MHNVMQCEAEDANGRTPLHYACYYSSSEVIAEMCRLRANVNHIDKKRRTPLHVVVCRAHSGMMHARFSRMCTCNFLRLAVQPSHDRCNSPDGM